MRCRNAEMRGFSLPELATAAAVIALLAGMAVNLWQDTLRVQRRAEAKAALAKALQMQERHYSRHGHYLAYDAAAPAGFPWHSGPTPQASAYELAAMACVDAPLTSCVLLTARPGSARVNPRLDDPGCGMLTLDSRGQQGSERKAQKCW
jgi:type IV pilus assembly protein PilE